MQLLCESPVILPSRPLFHFFFLAIFPATGKSRRSRYFSWPRHIITIIAFHPVQSTHWICVCVCSSVSVPFTIAASQKGSNALRDWLMKIITWHSRILFFFVLLLYQRRLPSLSCVRGIRSAFLFHIPPTVKKKGITETCTRNASCKHFNSYSSCAWPPFFLQGTVKNGCTMNRGRSRWRRQQTNKWANITGSVSLAFPYENASKGKRTHSQRRNAELD